jgi:hypothetical protein
MYVQGKYVKEELRNYVIISTFTTPTYTTANQHKIKSLQQFYKDKNRFALNIITYCVLALLAGTYFFIF